MKPFLYIAAPLFSEAEREFNRILKHKLSQFCQVYLPQDDGQLFVKAVANGSSIELARNEIFLGDLQAIKRADIILLVMDGRAVDEGACFELGFAYALGKKCLGLQTDPRRLLPIGNNPMIDGALYTIFQCVQELLEWFHDPPKGIFGDIHDKSEKE
ncbi:MAG: nucleoside 2-deoxyribosyltransferase [Desulfuromonadales bacterium]|nr:MAG: nucleoside 2-deoxyribosyltransferase [Desulfuromonadales bacterium]